MFHHSRKNFGLPAGPVAGFTIVELLVSIGIISVILSVVLSSQSTYTEGVALSNLADEIGLTLSQKQAYGIGVREILPGSSDFSVSYGLTFSLLDSGSNTAYLSFADKNENNFYDGTWSCPVGGTSECLGKTDISRGNHIDSLCVIRLSEEDFCDVGRIDISFNRPSTESQIIFFDTGGNPLDLSDSIGARILLKSPNDLDQTVTIYNTGQISIGSVYEYLYPTPSYTTPAPPPSPDPFNYFLSYDSNISVAQGSIGSNTITRTLLTGTTEAITLSASGLPTGASASFTSNPCNPTCSSTLTITTTLATPVGTYTVTVTGSPLSKTAQFSLEVTNAPFNYSLSNSGDITIGQGSSGTGSGSNTITRTLVSGTSEAVTLSASGLPTGASASFTSNPCSPTCSSTMTITTGVTTPAGTYPIV
ncbi:MAG: type II secretion system protein, partial [Minisyncoccia bacterium]